MSNSDVRPNAMSRFKALEEEERFLSSLRKSARRVKIDDNHTWQMRILPYENTVDGQPYVRLAQHWWNNAPVTCPTHTPKAWGGDPDHLCPVCELAERLNESSDEAIRNVGYRAKVTPRYRFWVVVFDKEDNRGNIDELPEEEIINPYEFDMYPTTFEYYKKFQKWAASRKNSPDMLDLENGFNVLATHGNKGVTLDRCDPSPIFDIDDKDWDKKVEVIWKRIKEPRIIIPGERDLRVLADKIEEYGEKRAGSDDRGGRGRDDDRRGGGGGGGGGRGRGRGRDERGSDRGNDRGNDRDYDSGGGSSRGRGRDSYSDRNDDSPRSRRAAQEEPPREERRDPAPPSRRSESQQESAPPPRRRQEASSERGGEDNDPEDQNKQQEKQESAPPPRRRQEVSADQQEERQERRELSAEDVGQDQTDAKPQTRQASAPPPRRRQEEQNGGAKEAPPQERYDNQKNDGDLGPEKRPAGRGHGGTGVDDNEDNAPEERRDPAPPVKDKPSDEPPPVRSSGPAPRPTRDSGALSSRLRNIAGKGN